MAIDIHLAAPHIKAVFFERNGGVSQGVYESLNAGLLVGDKFDDVKENHRRIAAYFDQPAQNLLYLHQVHSSDIIEAQNIVGHEQPTKADALITQEKGLVLAVQTADCMPILCADSENNIIAAIHAGWRGAFDGIIQKTIEKMIEKGANPQNIHGAIGPCIHQKSYEVDKAFRQNFLNKSAENERFFIDSTRKDHYLFDLPGYGAFCLAQKGVQHIQPSHWDTCAEPERFFSHRYACLHHQGQTGRLTAAISII